jgi:hypothetical protein
MSVLIIKLGATGDVARTTPLLRRFDGPVNWVTAENNLPLLEGIDRETSRFLKELRIVSPLLERFFYKRDHRNQC